MYVAVVKGNVARDRRAVLLGLGVDDVHVKVIAEIVVAATYFLFKFLYFICFAIKLCTFLCQKLIFICFIPRVASCISCDFHTLVYTSSKTGKNLPPRFLYREGSILQGKSLNCAPQRLIKVREIVYAVPMFERRIDSQPGKRLQKALVIGIESVLPSASQI